MSEIRKWNASQRGRRDWVEEEGRGGRTEGRKNRGKEEERGGRREGEKKREE